MMRSRALIAARIALMALMAWQAMAATQAAQDAAPFPMVVPDITAPHPRLLLDAAGVKSMRARAIRPPALH